MIGQNKPERKPRKSLKQHSLNTYTKLLIESLLGIIIMLSAVIIWNDCVNYLNQMNKETVEKWGQDIRKDEAKDLINKNVVFGGGKVRTCKVENILNTYQYYMHYGVNIDKKDIILQCKNSIGKNVLPEIDYEVSGNIFNYISINKEYNFTANGNTLKFA